MKLQPKTPPKVQEQQKASIKAYMDILEVVVKDCNLIFENNIEMWASLQKDLHVQNIEDDIREKQLQFDEIRATKCTLALVQWFTKLQEGKAIQTQSCRE